MSEKVIFREIAQRIEANGDPKLNAAVDFVARLLDSPAGPSIARILLFGSVARGEARPNSDVDVMTFGGLQLDDLKEYTAQAAWEATVEWGEQVAQLTFGLGDLFQPRTYLVYNALKRGKELYAMEEQEARRLEAQNLYRKAQRHSEQARHATANQDFELAVVGAYTAAELAAKALVLLKAGVDLLSTHGGLIQIFGREYIKTGEAPKHWGRMLSVGLESRGTALYNTAVMTDSRDAQTMLDLAQEMLDFLEQKISPLSPNPPTT